MKVDLTDRQLERIIELLRKSQIGSDDARLIEYLKRYQLCGKSTPANYDEIPFQSSLASSSPGASVTSAACKRDNKLLGTEAVQAKVRRTTCYNNRKQQAHPVKNVTRFISKPWVLRKR